MTSPSLPDGEHSSTGAGAGLLEGKVAYVTGSTRGIGLATARALAAHGATVVVNGRTSAETVAKRAAEIEAEHGRPTLGVHADQSIPEQANGAFREIFKTFGRLDVLVNNAGILDDALIGMISERSIEQTFATNALALVRNTQSAAKLMRRSGGGSIVNLASIVGTHGNAGEVVYSATKAAVLGITKSAAKELAPVNVRVNAVAPGFIDTDLTRTLPDDVKEQWRARIGMGRVGQPEDVADVILFLAGPHARYVTGQVIGIDGSLVL
jgi:3-oxoacyl-[acyl-carrier protein] reductase